MKKILLGSGVLLLALSIYFQVWQYIVPDVIQAFVEQFGPFAPLIYIILYAIAMFVPLLGTLMSIVGGLVFGPLYGTLLTIFAATVTSVLPFLVAKKYGREKIQAKLATSKYAKLATKADKNNFLFVFYLRLIPVMPYEVQNYVAGLTNISIPKFMLATMLGILPITFALNLLGDSLTDIASPKFLLAVAVMLVSIILPLGIRYLHKKNNKKSIVAEL
jgi:uncharacterized membrane protein YdjX (TVP38/TMEM64 family)